MQIYRLCKSARDERWKRTSNDRLRIIVGGSSGEALSSDLLFSLIRNLADRIGSDPTKI